MKLPARFFDEVWDRKTPLRQIGVQVTKLSGERYCQFDLFSPVDPVQYERKAKLDAAVDALRAQFGEDVIRRARFFGSRAGPYGRRTVPGAADRGNQRGMSFHGRLGGVFNEISLSCQTFVIWQLRILFFFLGRKYSGRLQE